MNINPTPQSGQGAFGMVPGALSLPNPAGDLSAQLPGLSKLNSTASGDLQSLLGGTLSAGTTNALQNAAATYGTTSGMSGGAGGMAGLDWNSLYGNIAGASTAQQQQGMQDYSSLIPTVSGTQTVSPTLQAQIAGTNASNAAAPNPTQAASYAEQLFNQYLNSSGGGGRVTNMPQSGFQYAQTSTGSSYPGGGDVFNVPNASSVDNSYMDQGYGGFGSDYNTLEPSYGGSMSYDNFA